MAYATTNPYTGEVVKSFPTAKDDEVKAAIGLADDAFKGWKNTSYEERAAVLLKAAEILRKRHTEYAKILTLEMGKLIAEAEAEVELSAKILEYYAKNGAAQLQPRSIPVEGLPADAAKLVYQPLGVLYIVEPWNFPYYQIVRISAPQLMAGNTLLLKHASNVPQAAATFEKLFIEAGLPKGAFINLYAAHNHSELILSDPRVRGVALTGSEPAGAAVASTAAKYLKKSTLELGGSDAFIVLDDADIDKAAKWAVFGRHWNAGQVCVSSKRIILVDSIYDEFMEKYRAGVAALKAGDPLDPSTTLAPLSSFEALELLKKQVSMAVAGGAKATVAGQPVPEKGAFYQPTILEDIAPKNPAYYTEMFGPVSQIYRVADEAAAVKMANDSPFGLGGSVFTKDPVRAQRVAKQIDTGMMYINHPTGVRADIPFGGVKNSGYGHELIDLGIHEFVNIKVIVDMPIDGDF
ncbi:NAD-dependent succinate-semialdehyde dehydrogenase [Pectinatus haikarae]|uniref:Succinate-semialdehyde dehydrogenase/glutarate-semialdehyde dehydrogenase n=1 Tax=Pectinatus haikarae TaxID=349096 RepID=A0ABT9Y6T0_9FIRM|nr:NAD-dependent succinate-semialdehyde dehydrogenase [Pectinatus haikarae]MDQ0203353.1 succinate-semialdehyde dehydrogenase/glutarate-semialdehyde dehydrogenase [Pectinatus haikarae]